MEARYKTYNDLECLEMEVSEEQERSINFHDANENEIQLCNIDCNKGYNRRCPADVKKNARGCIFRQGYNIRKRLTCPYSEEDVEANLVTLKKLRKILNKETEW